MHCRQIDQVTKIGSTPAYGWVRVVPGKDINGSRDRVAGKSITVRFGEEICSGPARPRAHETRYREDDCSGALERAARDPSTSRASS
jgi:hypothetical protein